MDDTVKARGQLLEGLRGLRRDNSKLRDRVALHRGSSPDRESMLSILEATSSLVSTAGADHRILYLNRAGRRMLGMQDAEDRSTLLDVDLMTPWTKRLVMEEARPIAERSGSWHGRLDFLARDGRVVPLSAALVAHPNPAGEIHQFSIIAHDISDQISAEDALRESKGLYHSLFKHMQDGFAFHRVITGAGGQPVDYVFLEVNGAFERMTGLLRANIAGKRISELLPDLPSGPFDWIRTYGRVALTGEPNTFEQYQSHLGKWFRVSAYSPRRGYFATTFRDVTQEKAAQEALAETNQALEALVRSSPLAIVGLDCACTVTSWNPAAEAVFGWPAAEVIGRPLPIVPPGGEQELQRILKEVLSGRPILDMHVERLRQDGSALHVSLSAAPVCGAGGEVSSIEVIYQDITERKRMSHALDRQMALSQALTRTASLLNSQLDLPSVLSTVCHEAAAATGVSAVAIYIYREDQDVFLPEASVGLPQMASEMLGPISRSDCEGQCAISPILVFDLDQEDLPLLANSQLYRRSGVRTLVCRELWRGKDLVGMIQLFAFGEPHHFADVDLALIDGLAFQAAQAVANACLFEEVLSGRERLRQLSHHLVETQEAERRHVAMELHDEIGQLLTGLQLSLHMAGKLSSETAAASLIEAKELTVELMQRVRDLSLNLRPGLLDDLGLLPALQWLVDRFGRQSGLRVLLKHSGIEGRRLPPMVEATAYRAIQEGLTNVARHSGTLQATVRIALVPARLTIQVEDEGRGFDYEETIRARRSSGVAGMLERVALLGGQMTVKSTPGKGTLITAELPIGDDPGGKEGSRR